MKKIKKIMALILTLVLFTTNTINTYAVNKKRIYTVEENGTKYTIELTVNGYEYNYIVSTDDTKDYSEIEIDLKNNEMEITECSYEMTTFWGQKKYNRVKEIYDLSQYDDNTNAESIFSNQTISYGSKTTEKWDDSYWYCYGSEGKKHI